MGSDLRAPLPDMVCFIPAEASSRLLPKSLSRKPDQKGSPLGMEKPGGTAEDCLAPVLSASSDN